VLLPGHGGHATVTVFRRLPDAYDAQTLLIGAVLLPPGLAAGAFFWWRQVAGPLGRSPGASESPGNDTSTQARDGDEVWLLGFSLDGRMPVVTNHRMRSLPVLDAAAPIANSWKPSPGIWPYESPAGCAFSTILRSASLLKGLTDPSWEYKPSSWTGKYPRLDHAVEVHLNLLGKTTPLEQQPEFHVEGEGVPRQVGA
jgi:hypothetical protein